MDAVHELKALSELGQQEEEAADPVAAARQDHHKLCDRRALSQSGWAHSHIPVWNTVPGGYHAARDAMLRAMQFGGIP